MRGDREIGVTTCNEMEARLLDLGVGTACLSLQLQVHDEEGRPIEYMRSVNHPKLVVFKTGQIDMTPPVQANEANRGDGEEFGLAVLV
jgi:GntR family transcriptional regulator